MNWGLLPARPRPRAPRARCGGDDGGAGGLHSLLCLFSLAAHVFPISCWVLLEEKLGCMDMNLAKIYQPSKESPGPSLVQHAGAGVMQPGDVLNTCVSSLSSILSDSEPSSALAPLRPSTTLSIDKRRRAEKAWKSVYQRLTQKRYWWNSKSLFSRAL